MNHPKFLLSDSAVLTEFKTDKDQIVEEDEMDDDDDEDDMYLYDDEPPAYNITNRLQEINHALAMESIPEGYEERQRKVIFRENLVDFEIPPTPNYSSDDNDDGYGDSTEVSDDLAEETEGDSSKTVTKKNEVNRRIDQGVLKSDILQQCLNKVKDEITSEESFLAEEPHILDLPDRHLTNSNSFANKFTNFLDQQCVNAGTTLPTNYVQPNSVADEIGQLFQRLSKLSLQNTSQISQVLKSEKPEIKNENGISEDSSNNEEITIQDKDDHSYVEENFENVSSNLEEDVCRLKVQDATSIQMESENQNEKINNSENQNGQINNSEILNINEKSGEERSKVDSEHTDKSNLKAMETHEQTGLDSQINSEESDFISCSGEEGDKKANRKISISVSNYNYVKKPIFARIPAKPKMTSFRWKRAMRQLHLTKFTENLSKSNIGISAIHSSVELMKPYNGTNKNGGLESSRLSQSIQTEKLTKGNEENSRNKIALNTDTEVNSTDKIARKDESMPNSHLNKPVTSKHNNRLLTARPTSSLAAVSIGKERGSINLEETMIMASKGKFHMMKMDAFQSISNIKRPSTSPAVKRLPSTLRTTGSDQLCSNDSSLVVTKSRTMSRQYLTDERSSLKISSACTLRPLSSNKQDTNQFLTERRCSVRGPSSTFKLTPEQKKERLRKLQLLSEERHRKLSQEAEENLRKREQVDKVYKEWLKSKRHQGSQQKQPQNDNHAPRLQRTTSNGAAFQKWLQQKKIQKREEAEIAEVKRKVEESMFCIRRQEDNEKAFKKWLNTKNKTDRLKRSQIRRKQLSANNLILNTLRRSSAKPS